MAVDALSRVEGLDDLHKQVCIYAGTHAYIAVDEVVYSLEFNKLIKKLCKSLKSSVLCIYLVFLDVYVVVIFNLVPCFVDLHLGIYACVLHLHLNGRLS